MPSLSPTPPAQTHEEVHISAQTGTEIKSRKREEPEDAIRVPDTRPIPGFPFM